MAPGWRCHSQAQLTLWVTQHLNSAHNVNVPFILMNSFNTDEDTARIIQKYANHRIELMTFNQSRYPRVNKESLLPCPKSALEDKGAWYPPGHGDLFDAIMNSGLVDKLLASGKEYLFVSNVDNLGAVVDSRILEHMHTSGAEFLMEVTDKTKADVKGGTLINYEGNVRLLEIAQVPSDHVEDFKSVRKFKIFSAFSSSFTRTKAHTHISQTRTTYGSTCARSSASWRTTAWTSRSLSTTRRPTRERPSSSSRRPSVLPSSVRVECTRGKESSTDGETPRRLRQGARHQRPSLPLPPRQVLLGPAAVDERSIYSEPWDCTFFSRRLSSSQTRADATRPPSSA